MFIQKIQSKIIINKLMIGSHINNRQKSIPCLYTATNNLKMQLKNSIYIINKNCVLGKKCNKIFSDLYGENDQIFLRDTKTIPTR